MIPPFCVGIATLSAASRSKPRRKAERPSRPAGVKDRLRPAQLVGNNESSVKLYLKLGFGGAHTESNQRRGGMDEGAPVSHSLSMPCFLLLFLGSRRQHPVQAQIHCGFGVVVGPSTCEDHAGPGTGTLASGEDFRGLG